MGLLARNGFKSYSAGIRIRSKVFHTISALKNRKASAGVSILIKACKFIEKGLQQKRQ